MKPGPGSRFAGIYTITTPSGRMYVGSSCDVWTRWRQHRARLINGKHESKQLLFAWRKHGKALRFELLLVCSRENLMLYEQIAIDALNPALNVGAALCGTLGKPRSEETKAKIAAALRGRKRPEIGQKVSAAQQGRKRGPQSPQHKAAIAAAKVAFYAARRASANSLPLFHQP